MGNGDKGNGRPLTVRELETLLNATKQNTEQFTLLAEGMAKVFGSLDENTKTQKERR
jgi:hypothetical protein